MEKPKPCWTPKLYFSLEEMDADMTAALIKTTLPPTNARLCWVKSERPWMP